MNIIEQIKAEIERLRGIGGIFSLDNRGYESALIDIEIFLDTLESEKPMEEGLDVTDFCKPIDPGIAQCIADHSWEMLGEDENPVPKDLKEAARKYQEGVPVDTVIYYCGADEDVYFTNRIVDAFIAGAKWDMKQMMKEAVEGLICATITGTNAISFLSPLPKELIAGDKVRIIIVKEDSNE